MLLVCIFLFLFSPSLAYFLVCLLFRGPSLSLTSKSLGWKVLKTRSCGAVCTQGVESVTHSSFLIWGVGGWLFWIPGPSWGLTQSQLLASMNPESFWLFVVVQLLHCDQLFVTPWTAAHQASWSFFFFLLLTGILLILKIISKISKGLLSFSLEKLIYFNILYTDKLQTGQA